ncbi:MAG TPA: hypothetical protein VJT14_16805 [Candidatus Dormibacteraeota bacterium]|nr:hypothetical protein [Candidatus Dormibacteraeota bacterium]
MHALILAAATAAASPSPSPAPDQVLWGLPLAFWDGVIGAVIGAFVGGLLTVVGGYFATRRIRSLDNQAAERRAGEEFWAAALVVIDEMNANIATLEVTLQHDQNSIPELHDSVYREQQLVLALRLPVDVRSALAEAYIYAQTPRVLRLTPADVSIPPGDHSYDTANLENVRACYTKTKLARAKLLAASSAAAKAPAVTPP